MQSRIQICMIGRFGLHKVFIALSRPSKPYPPGGSTWFGGGGFDPDELQELRLSELKELFLRTFGEPTASNNRHWLVTKLSQPRDATGAGRLPEIRPRDVGAKIWLSKKATQPGSQTGVEPQPEAKVKRDPETSAKRLSCLLSAASGGAGGAPLPESQTCDAGDAPAAAAAAAAALARARPLRARKPSSKGLPQEEEEEEGRGAGDRRRAPRPRPSLRVPLRSASMKPAPKGLSRYSSLESYERGRSAGGRGLARAQGHMGTCPSSPSRDDVGLAYAGGGGGGAAAAAGAAVAYAAAPAGPAMGASYLGGGDGSSFAPAFVYAPVGYGVGGQGQGPVQLFPGVQMGVGQGGPQMSQMYQTQFLAPFTPHLVQPMASYNLASAAAAHGLGFSGANPLQMNVGQTGQHGHMQGWYQWPGAATAERQHAQGAAEYPSHPQGQAFMQAQVMAQPMGAGLAQAQAQGAIEGAQGQMGAAAAFSALQGAAALLHTLQAL